MRYSLLVFIACAMSLSACSHHASFMPPVTPQSNPEAALIDASSSAVSSASLGSSIGRINVGHVFDSGISTLQIESQQDRYDVVWGSFNPSWWQIGDPSALISRYYILGEDSYWISGHTLAWWQANHPDWILYACGPDGIGTHQIAYDPGVGVADVPLDLHNPSVVDYQLNKSLIPYVQSHGYNAVAFDQVLLSDELVGGNPLFKQSILPGYYGCGVWQGNTFVKRYSGRTDPRWPADVLHFLQTAHALMKPLHIAVIVNHPGGSSGSNEDALLGSVDVDVSETGFSDYGYYTQSARAAIFATQLRWTTYAQSKGVRVLTIDKFTTTPSITVSQVDYALATYALSNNGAADLVIAGTSYSVQPYYAQYATNIGAPCGAVYGGAAYDALNPHVYYRRFANGLAVVNSGSLPKIAEVAFLPKNHVYRDVMGRAVTNPLIVPSNDAFTMLTSGGSGCL